MRMQTMWHKVSLNENKQLFGARADGVRNCAANPRSAVSGAGGAGTLAIGIK